MFSSLNQFIKCGNWQQDTISYRGTDKDLLETLMRKLTGTIMRIIINPHEILCTDAEKIH